MGWQASPTVLRTDFSRFDGKRGLEIEDSAFLADVDIHNLELIEIQDLPSETGWGRVPTPIF